MKIYFAANQFASAKKLKQFSEIIKLLSDAGITVMSNIEDENVTEFSEYDMEQINKSGEVLLDKMDALIIEGSEPPAESGYLIALSLAHKKQILYLTEKGSAINKTLLQLQKGKESGRYLSLASYDKKGASDVVLKFIQSIEHGEQRDIPNIKFTLRITPKIDRYLTWKAKNKKLTKADFLREQIQQMLDLDQLYQSKNKSKKG
jgi:hypothetical protein